MSCHNLFSLRINRFINCSKPFIFNPLFALLLVLFTVTFSSAYAFAATRQLVFDPSPDNRVIGYNLYYGQSEDFDIVVDLKEKTSHELTNLEDGATYYFAATAYDELGNESVLSDTLVYVVDGCPDDPFKTSPGLCGCGVADTDSDGDGVPDCLDGCPNDPFKTNPGLCGCGVADADSDGDGVADCLDGCPNDPFKTNPGLCGCGVADADSDGDGVPDCLDGCPNDPFKTNPGLCGCGVADADSDGDGVADCLDNCPNDPFKTDPGLCGCGVADADSDGDGVADCLDGCPNDPEKTEPGICGCGVSDADSDGNGIPDCVDQCYYNQPLVTTVAFDPSSDERVIGYKLYYGQSETFDTVIDLKENTSYDLPDLQEGTTYYFAATAYDEYDNESEFSEILIYSVPETHVDCGNINPDPIFNEQNIVEMGEVLVNHLWQKVTFKGNFIDPVVVAKPASLNNSEPAVVRIRNVNESGFEVRIQQWDYLDGFHGVEQVSYLVMENGSYVLPGGIMIEAGKFEADGSKYFFKSFTDSFKQNPVVLASVTSINGSNAVVGRIRNISLKGFEYRLQEQETTIWRHGKETVSFIACEPFSGVLNSMTIEVGTTGNRVDHNFYYLPYNETFLNVPKFLADMQTTNGTDTANVRYRYKDHNGVEINIAEEQSKDSEIRHVKENVGYIIISE